MVPIQDVVAHAVRKIGREVGDESVVITSVTVKDGRAEVYFASGDYVAFGKVNFSFIIIKITRETETETLCKKHAYLVNLTTTPRCTYLMFLFQILEYNES